MKWKQKQIHSRSASRGFQIGRRSLFLRWVFLQKARLASSVILSLTVLGGYLIRQECRRATRRNNGSYLCAVHIGVYYSEWFDALCCCRRSFYTSYHNYFESGCSGAAYNQER